jgi:arylsulfatase A-like enzyme
MSMKETEEMILPGLNNLTRRGFLKVAGCASLAAGAAWALWRVSTDEPRKPNILVIVADDLGYADTGFQGCRDIPTPNVDSIASNGVIFTDGYVSCPVCAPTRAGILTGRYQQRFGFEHNPGPESYAAENFGLPLSEKTLAERLKPLGYATGMVGKWHVGFKRELTPPERGFDEFFGFLNGAHNYLPRKGAQQESILRGHDPVEEKEYLTDAFGREASAFVEKHKEHPFFLYLPFNAVHSPLDASPKLLEKFASINDPLRRTYATMLASMDDAIGRVLEKLREHHLEENTLIFFLSDNGGPTTETSSRNDPLRGNKAQVYEGGIRIPFAMQWKGHLPAGKKVNQPIIALDIVPTVLYAASSTPVTEDKLDGVNLLPFLKGETEKPPHDQLFWRMGEQHAARIGDWKLVGRRGQAAEIYYLPKDISEKTDLAARHPEKVKELQTAYNEWNAKNIPAQWVRQDRSTEPSGSTSREERFDRLDRNGDGKISPAELPQPELFKRLDRDGDGFISKKDL